MSRHPSPDLQPEPESTFLRQLEEARIELRDHDPAVRFRALDWAFWVISAHPGAYLTPGFIEAYMGEQIVIAATDADTDVQEKAVGLLRFLRSTPTAVDALVRALADQKPAIRKAALRSTGAVLPDLGSDERVSKALHEVLDDLDPEVRKVALQSVAPAIRDSGPLVVALARKAMKDGVNEIRKAAVELVSPDISSAMRQPILRGGPTRGSNWVYHDPTTPTRGPPL